MRWETPEQNEELRKGGFKMRRPNVTAILAHEVELVRRRVDPEAAGSELS